MAGDKMGFQRRVLLFLRKKEIISNEDYEQLDMAMKDGRKPDGGVSQELRNAITDVKKTASQIGDILDKTIAVLVIVLSHPVIRADMPIRQTVQSLKSNVNRSRNDSLLHIGRILPGSVGYVPVTFDFDSDVSISTQRMANSDGTYIVDCSGEEVLVRQTKFEVKLDEMTDIIWALYENIANSKKCSPENIVKKLRGSNGLLMARNARVVIKVKQCITTREATPEIIETAKVRSRKQAESGRKNRGKTNKNDVEGARGDESDVREKKKRKLGMGKDDVTSIWMHFATECKAQFEISNEWNKDE
eukprot:Nk52_evm18s240 gene=Nk52_evmTU18s240